MMGIEAAIRVVELVTARLGCEQDETPSSPAQALRRAAWRHRTDALPLSEVLGFGAAMPGIRLDVGNLGQSVMFSPGVGRVLLNLLLLATDGLPGGGSVSLAGAADDLFIRLDGARAAWPGRLTALLHDEAATMAALPTEAGFQAALTVLLAREAGLRLSLVIPAGAQAAPPLLRLTG